MFPEGFIRRIKTQEYLDPEGLLKALQNPSPVSIRINPFKWDKRPLNSDPVPWCSTGYYLSERPIFSLDPLFHSGCYYPQEASGMFIEQIFKQMAGLPENIKVLDLCGAPGGKSTHISSLIGNEGLLVANEVIKERALILAENISKLGAANTIVTQSDPSAFSALKGYFDVILVDAPCSGEGMFRDKVAVIEWSEEKTFHCSVRQRRILKDVWPALKENGILIFSTCTFNPDENEENVKWFLSENMAEAVEIDISDFNGVTRIDHNGIIGYGFYPGRIKGEGLFISVIRKRTDAGGKIAAIKRGIKSGGFVKSYINIVYDWTTFREENIFRSGDLIYHFPAKSEDYHLLKQHIKIIKPGTKICKIKRNGYVPAHELALSQGIREKAFRKSELDLTQALSYLKHESNLPVHLQDGWFLVTYKNINMGFCNNIGSRINNYYPMEWRIRMQVPESEKINLVGWDQN